MNILIHSTIVDKFEENALVPVIKDNMTNEDYAENARAILNLLYKAIPAKSFNIFAVMVGMTPAELSEACQKFRL